MRHGLSFGLALGAALLVHAVALMAPALATAPQDFWRLEVPILLALASGAVVSESSAVGTRVARPQPVRIAADTRARRLATATGLTLMAVHAVGLASWGPPLPWLTLLAGIPIMIGGIALRRLAIAQLQRFFRTEVTVDPEQSLVRDGVYGVLRHPSELGLLLQAYGSAMVMQSLVAAMLATIVLLPLVGLRLLLEERHLRAAFGRAYHDYARKVPALLPYPLRRVALPHRVPPPR